jgi:nondiscriminating glutamyl-tRNA synthetase
MSDKVRVRFAPSPTGYLHIGGARTTLFNWLYAQHHKGTFILRIEDTDEVRSTPESVTTIIESLQWLGLEWNEGPDHADAEGKYGVRGEFGPYFQMERVEIYAKYVKQLIDEDKAYKCYCTKDELDVMRRQAMLEKRPPLYDRRCSRLTDAQKQEYEEKGKKFSIRVRMEEDGTTVVRDLIRGNVEFDNRLQQDLVIQKQTGGPTYNFACVIDDHLMGLTHVIRGDEHLSNTPSQLNIYRQLGWEPPQFAHLSMILGPDKTKLSKRHGATSVMEYKEQGYLPGALRNYLALLGWATSDSQNIFEHDELIAKFDVDRCQKSPAVFDPEKLKWMNGEYLRKLEPKKLFELAKPFLKPEWAEKFGEEHVFKAIALEQEKYKLLSDVPNLVDFFYEDVVFDEKSERKVLLKDGVTDLLSGITEHLEKLDVWNEAELEKAIRGFCEAKDIKTGKVFHPLRVSVTGRTQGPTLFGMLELMGKDMVIARLIASRERLLAKAAATK